MASSEPTDDSFRARVDKVFGSLSSSQPSSLRPLWSLTDDEVEKREWKRDRESSNRDDETPCSSSFDGLFMKDRKIRRERKDDLDGLYDRDDDDDDDGRLGSGSSKSSFKHGDGDEKDEWEIRSSIGLDCTLDNEEEEDEYDRVAEGRENAGDRLYMKDVADHGRFLNSHNVLPNSVNAAPRDVHTSHMDALIRLKEDEAAAEKFDAYQTCEKFMLNVEEPPVKESENDGKLKSILKRKDNETVSQPQKRVRFDLGCKDNWEESEKPQEFLTAMPSMEIEVLNDETLLPKNTSRIPDYVLNPSKYTRYSFDSSSEFNEESNAQACMEFLKLVKRSKPAELGSELEDSSADLPKSVTFIPRMKASNAKAVNNSREVEQSHKDASKLPLIQKSFPVGIAAREAQQSEISVMDKNEPETKADGNTGSQKLSRRYRAKSKLDDPVS